MPIVQQNETETDLVERARSGDIGAFETLYRKSAGRTYGLCLRMTNDRTLADDLCQEAYVRAWQKLATFKGTSAFSTWMHRLTVNVVLASFRKNRHSTGKTVDFDELGHLEATAAPARPGAALDLESAISRLPDRARTVFILHDVEGYKHSEIADLAGMAVGTSKAHLNRARKLLREALTS